MPRKTGHSRLQYGLFATPLEDLISPDNPVRVIDAFVDSLDLEALGFRAVRAQARGASSFGPDVLLKIYFYGYQNHLKEDKIARKLERIKNRIDEYIDELDAFDAQEIEALIANRRRILQQRDK